MRHRIAILLLSSAVLAFGTGAGAPLRHDGDGRAPTASANGRREAAPNTPLIDAIVQGYDREALELIRKGADVNTKDPGDDGSPPLYYAAGEGMLGVVKALVDRGADVNARGIGGFTPLLAACEPAAPPMVEYLLAHGADVSVRERSNGDTPLHVVVAADLDSDQRPEVVRILIRHGADVNARNKEGKTPLDVAKEKGLGKLADLLVEKGGKRSKDLGPTTRPAGPAHAAPQAKPIQK